MNTPQLLSIACLLALSSASMAASIDPNDIRVIDGDTIRVYHQQPNVRLVGFNAPETRKAQCEPERELGARATRRLRDLIRDGNLDFEFVACSWKARQRSATRSISTLTAH
jgi:endonuclease YncB( thermonuclease family)